MAKGTNIGKAYVQIVPSAEGIKGSITQALGDEPVRAGKATGSKLASAIKGIVVAAGIGKAVASSLSAGADLQQSLGGIETLYKGSADRMKQYASQSFQTAGVSANKYMETVTSFSAAMISSLGGDTRKAADLSNQAMIDMSDNANKMGTDMETIMHTYQSLSRGNYAMLDNLKLGFGGTKTEMQRLLAEAEKLTGKKFDISNFADITEAIHAIQVEMGITGTTALEAQTTFTGSFNSMKAAATDFMGALSLGMDITVPMQNLVQTASTFFFGNFLPMIGNIVVQIPQAVITAITTATPIIIEQMGMLFTNIGLFFTTQLPQFLQQGKAIIDNLIVGFVNNFPIFMQNVTNFITTTITNFVQALPQFVQRGQDFINYIVQGFNTTFPVFMSAVSNSINQIIQNFISNLPQFLQQGVNLLNSVIQGFVSMAPTFLSSVLNTIVSAIGTFASNLPQFLQKGIEMLGQVVSGLLSAVPQLIGAIPGILASAAQTFMSYDWMSIGMNIISGIVNGIVGAGGQIVSALMGIAQSAFDSVLGFLGIKSPSRLFRDKVGKMIPAGIAVGIEMDNTLPKQIRTMAERTVYDAKMNFSGMDIVTRSKFEQTLSLGNMSSHGYSSTQNITINSAKELSPSEIAQELADAQRRLRWI